MLNAANPTKKNGIFACTCAGSFPSIAVAQKRWSIPGGPPCESKGITLEGKVGPPRATATTKQIKSGERIFSDVGEISALLFVFACLLIVVVVVVVGNSNSSSSVFLMENTCVICEM